MDTRPPKREPREGYDDLVENFKDQREINIACNQVGSDEMTEESWEGLDERSRNAPR